MQPPRVYTRGILHFFGGIRRSTCLRQGYGRSDHRIHPRAYPAFQAVGYYGGVGRSWSSAKADKFPGSSHTPIQAVKPNPPFLEGFEPKGACYE